MALDQGGTADSVEDPDQPCPAYSAVQAVAESCPTVRGLQEAVELRSGIDPADYSVCLACLDLVEDQNQDQAGESLTGPAGRRCRGPRTSP